MTYKEFRIQYVLGCLENVLKEGCGDCVLCGSNSSEEFINSYTQFSFFDRIKFVRIIHKRDPLVLRNVWKDLVYYIIWRKPLHYEHDDRIKNPRRPNIWRADKMSFREKF